MKYSNMKKEELIALLKENESLVEAGKTLIHLPKAIEAKDKEINVLKEAKNQLIEKKDVALKELEERLAEKYQKEYLELKTRTDAELKKTKDALAESQKKNYDLDALRITQLEEVLYAYGDFLKLTQASVDSHMKLNEYIVNRLQGGNK